MTNGPDDTDNPRFLEELMPLPAFAPRTGFSTPLAAPGLAPPAFASALPAAQPTGSL